MRSKHDILQHIDELVVRHTVFLELRDQLLSAIQDGARGRIVMAVGPTGVGKTWLALDMIEILNDYVDKNPELGFSRPLYLEAESPEYGEFTWRSFYVQALRKLGEFALNHKRNVDNLIEELKLGKPISGYQHIHVHEMRTLYLEALEEFRPIAVFIDEAASLGKSKSHEHKGGNLNVLKSFSNQRTTIQVLLATIEAKKMLNYEAQTARRVEPFPFWHYGRADFDVDYFLRVIGGIPKELGIRVERPLFTDKQFIYAHSLGLVGVGVEWLRRGIELMFREKARVLSHHHLAQTRLTNSQLRTMTRDMAEFEAEYSDTADFDVYAAFGRPELSVKTQDEELRSASHKPGTRLPMRDSTTVRGA